MSKRKSRQRQSRNSCCKFKLIPTKIIGITLIHSSEMSLWRIPIVKRDWFRITLCCSVYILSFFFLISGASTISTIPDLGQFCDIFAGVEMSFAKWLFMYLNWKQLAELIQLMNDKDVELHSRAISDNWIKSIRANYYFHEMFLFILSMLFSFIFISVMYLQVLLIDPVELVVPSQMPFDISFGTVGFWYVHFSQALVSFFVAFFNTSADILFGNIYSQLILHLEVLNYDFKLLNENTAITSTEMLQTCKRLISSYQSLRQLSRKCEKCLEWFFINNIVSTMVAMTFSCVELGIMIGNDLSQCVKPFLFFVFINIPFFYWCWLGHRLQESSSRLTISAFIYKESASTTEVQKLQLKFLHIVQDSMGITAGPFFKLNYGLFVAVSNSFDRRM